MPLYRYECPKCDHVYDDVRFSLADHVDLVFDWCPKHGHQEFVQVLTPVAVDDWGNEGTDGRFFEHLAPTGMRFRDKRSYKEHLKKNGLVEWSPKRGMPGCDA